MTLSRQLGRGALAGFAYGGLAYGVPLSLMHLAHNSVGSLGVSLATGVWMALIYGLWAAVTAGGAILLVVAWRAVRKPPGKEGQLQPGLFLGLLAFNLFFWELAVLYGLTYDQVPFGPPEGPAGMVSYVVALVILLAALVTVVTWALFGLLSTLARRGRLRPLVLGLTALALLVHLAAPWIFGKEASAALVPPPQGAVETTTPALPGVRRVYTGLKVVVVGLDGADWQVIRPLVEAGELPAFRALMEAGAAGDLATLPDANSAVIWASMYTGHRPEEHGILDFYRISLPGTGAGLFPVHRTYFKELVDQLAKIGLVGRQFVSRYVLERVPIWEITAHAGISTGVVDGYFYSFPAPPSDDPRGFFLAYGTERFELRRQESGSDRDKDLFVQPPGLFRRLQPMLGQEDFDWQAEVLLTLLSGETPQPDFVNLYTHEPDRVQHLEWKWWQPELYLGVDPEETAERGDRIPSQYRKFDAFLAELMAKLKPNTVVILASDHGHAVTLLHSNFYTQHRHGPPGILLMAGGPIRAGVSLEGAHIYDLFPTLLHLLGLPIPEDVPGEVLTEALEPGFRERFGVRRIPTYEGLWPDRWRGGGGLSAEQSEEELRELRALGYMN